LFEILKGLRKNWQASDTSLKDNAMEASNVADSFIRNHAGVSDQVRVRHGDDLGTILALIVVVPFSIFTARPALTRHHAPGYVTMTPSGPSGRGSGAFP
jgi:hypothetical protein